MRKKLILLFLCITPAISVFSQKQLKLENENLIAVFNPSNGSLIELKNKKTNWDVAYREKLGQSFEMLIPLAERRFHNVRGTDQTTPEIISYKDSIVFIWKSLKSKVTDQIFNIEFRGTIALDKNGLKYGGQVINNSGYTIEYVAWPYFGEVGVPDKTKNMVFQSRNSTRNLFPAFFSEYGYWGVEYPTTSRLLPEESFLLIRNDEQGLYVSSEQTVPEEMVIATFELIPGYEINNKNPLGNVMDGQEVRIQFKANHVIYAHDKSTVTLSPMNIIFYEGSWHKGADLYNNRKKTWDQTIKSAGWIKQPLTWQKINISSGQDLIRYAKEAKEQGVSVLGVNGWKRNGNGNHIGTIENLQAAIRECQKIGIHVILGINFSSVDFRSEWYKNELKNYVMTDPFNISYDRGLICPLSEEVQQISMYEYAKNTSILTADGSIIDDNNHRNKTYFCFNPNHGHKVPEWIDKGTIQMDQEYTIQVKKSHKDFVSLGHGFYDFQTTFYDGYYIQSSVSGSPLHRYINPQIPIIASMDVRNARKDMNLCLRNRYNICYDLNFYNNQLKIYPKIMEYGRQIETLRNKFRDFIWEGEFNDILGASVNGNNIIYAVYTRKSDGKKAVIITNQHETELSSVRVSLTNSKNTLIMVSPENPETVPCNGNITLRPLSAIVVIEK
ncbi:hypothetical protein FACS1894174_01280 [Bacteroidia bacterium]|nr:hypothetical protein FACS1894203_2190 [Bacteroidia bacterium]GHV20102.1 hypothetical protein FACS1894174_01280 [Bacteroidia bacterium]